MPGLAPWTIGAVPGSTPSQHAVIPRGVIWMWSGRVDQIPPGWALCDGRFGTPNLLARFVKGVATANSNPGTTGGSTTHLHGHSATHSHEIPFQFQSGIVNITASLGTGSSVASTWDWNTNSETNSRARQKTNAVSPGNTDSADGQPPYYEIAYIMKL